ncbi:DNA-directed RNA polymerase subunit beta [Candidatus Zinderia endosymbiont of Aphrophora alni]|uniref:DNA-directed RNA polymerase subunit beta n=1 Tax=Candidatus Zinderia endosymbiont of Aphrophora alni TaxID=3077951 RepID=UPI0030CCF5BC
MITKYIDSFIKKKSIRKSFTNRNKVFKTLNLLEIQLKSYEKFLQKDIFFLKRKNYGLQFIFKTFFPVASKDNSYNIEYLYYFLEKPIFNIKECKERGLTYSSVLKVMFRLNIFYKGFLETKVIKEIKEQEIFMGEIPLMTNFGTFIINGTERTVVSQLYKSPGVFFDYNKKKFFSDEKIFYNAKIVPYKGSWLEFEFDSKDILFFRIDRRAKMPVTILLKAMGMTVEKILYSFSLYDKFLILKNFVRIKIIVNRLLGKKINFNLFKENGKLLIKKNEIITLKKLRIDSKTEYCIFLVKIKYLLGRVLKENIISNIDKKIVIAYANETITKDLLFMFIKHKIKVVKIIYSSNINYIDYISKILNFDKTLDSFSAKKFIYKIMRPGDSPTIDTVEIFFKNLFFNKKRYNLSLIGRMKLNSRFGFDSSYGTSLLSIKDIIYVIKTLINLKNNIGSIDDIDHLGNRRIRSVGELLENQLKFAFNKTEKFIKERLNYVEQDNLMPHDFINSKTISTIIRDFFCTSQLSQFLDQTKTISTIIRDFFCTSQLSQFLDQTNSLSEITHKRRISSLGPGGLTRERAGFEVRDVHYTHYGRVCPIETPEGPNIGLINSLALFSKLDKYGFLETPYYKVVNKKVTSEIKYLNAFNEAFYTIAQANSIINNKKELIGPLVSARKLGNNIFVSPEKIDFIDVSPNQIVSLAASLIPFLEHDDANRALMGANMQRQAVPCMKAQRPLVGTGLEKIVISNSGDVIRSLRGGKIIFVDSNKIVISVNEDEIMSNDLGIDVYNLVKYSRTNQDTNVNQKIIVNVGDLVLKNDVIADCSSSHLGELSLGQNILVAFMSWNGYNFEDSIIISKKIVVEEVYTSIHVKEFVVLIRDTKLGFEKNTRKVPNLPKKQKFKLDDSGIIHLGAEVVSGDVLVGKITPKNDIQITPEEKLICAIFKEKISNFKDTSFRVPPQICGTVINVEIFTKKGIIKDERSIQIIKDKLEKYKLNLMEKIFFIENDLLQRLKKKLINKFMYINLDVKNKIKITKKFLLNLKLLDLFEINLEDKNLKKFLKRIKKLFFLKQVYFQDKYIKKKKKLTEGDELPSGVLKIIKIFLAIKKKLQPGDKMSGRHGNKGVVSCILNIEDMPYMSDGTVVDIILNPLGIPSRMNVGQILEAHLGWAAKGLGLRLQKMINSQKNLLEIRKFLEKIYNFSYKKENFNNFNDNEILELIKNISNGVYFSTPVFDGATEKDIDYLLNLAYPKNISKKLKINEKKNQIILYDGRTGEAFKQFITVGYIYFLKLNHLVNDKIHSRSIGPYSLITQQPLGGKSQFGGQRFGEMEVWALEAYGASYTLQEMLTIKSDDINGRTEIYKNLINNIGIININIPESFNVLIREIRSLGIDIKLKYK